MNPEGTTSPKRGVNETSIFVGETKLLLETTENRV